MLLRTPKGPLATALLAVVCCLGMPAASAADASTAEPEGDGLTSALAAVASKLAAMTVAASSTRSPASSSPSGASRFAPRHPAGVSARRAPRLHRLAVLRGSVGLSERPRGPMRLRIGPSTEFGSPRVLAVAARRGNRLGVIATERPNNRLAWVRRRSRALQMRRTRWSLHADLSARTLTLRKRGRRVRRMSVAIGRPGSKTPTGRFAVTDKLDGARFGPYYGCCILALSGHQPNTPPGWTGGDRLALHGTDSPSTIGAAASAGCLRASNTDLRPLMRRVPLGTQIFIHG
jgi:lipoprotein-anchoring transpeptidase ErfK/SrfK